MGEKEESGTETALSSLLKIAESPEKVNDIVDNLAKYEQLLKKVSGILGQLDKIGVLPAVIRAIGVKQNIPDIDKPLVDPLSLKCASVSHMMLFGELNKAPEEVIKEMYRQAVIADEKGKGKK